MSWREPGTWSGLRMDTGRCLPYCAPITFELTFGEDGSVVGQESDKRARRLYAVEGMSDGKKLVLRNFLKRGIKAPVGAIQALTYEGTWDPDAEAAVGTWRGT